MLCQGEMPGIRYSKREEMIEVVYSFCGFDPRPRIPVLMSIGRVQSKRRRGTFKADCNVEAWTHSRKRTCPSDKHDRQTRTASSLSDIVGE